MPSFVDLFAGPGGLSLGFVLAGWDPESYLEKNNHACITYEKNINPRCKGLCKDARYVDAQSFKDIGVRCVDAVIGGPPCRPFSNSNTKKKGENHEEYSLPIKFVEIALGLKPKAVLLEEVPPFRKYLKEEIIKKFKAGGYVCIDLVLNATDFGVPQKRRRMFIICLAGNSTKLLNEVKLILRDYSVKVKQDIEKEFGRPFVSVRDALSDLPSEPVHSPEEPLDYSRPPQNSYQRLMRSVPKISTKVYNHATTVVREEVVKRFRMIKPGENLRKAIERMLKSSNELPEEFKGFSRYTQMHSNVYRRLDPNDVSFTITNPRKAMIIHPWLDRLITVREAARLQSFPDSFVFLGPLYVQQQMVADAVPPLLAKALGLALKKIL